MAGEWKRHEVSALIESGALVVGDGYRAKNSELKRSGLPFARAGNINAGFLFDDADCFPEENLQLVGNKVSQPGDVVFTSKGTVGRFAFVRLDTPRFVYSPQLCFWRSVDCELIDPRFLSFWMSGREFYIQFKGVAGQTDMAEYVSLTDQRRMHITLPPLPEQHAIAHILGTLDDKIELNRRMNETLEAMARALFKAWFVDFDPVRAKSEGRDTGLPKPLADLFPDSFEDSELGEIPKGWKIEPLSEITTVITKGTTPTQSDAATSDRDDGEVNYVRVNAIDVDGTVLYEKLTTIPELVHLGILKRSVLQAGDVLYTIAGTIGRSAIVDESLLPANTNQAIAIIRPKHPIPAAFLVLTMRAAAFREELHSNIVHAVQANLSLGILSSARAVVPPKNNHLQLFMPIANLTKRVASARAESRTLATLRDTLLPKLISGGLRVKDA